jgi:hypothetical protein
MARRKNGTGSVFLRGDGRWEAQLRLPDGRRKCVYAQTRRQVVSRLRETRWELANGLPGQQTQTASARVPRLLARAEPAHLRHNTHHSLRLGSRRILQEIGESR